MDCNLFINSGQINSSGIGYNNFVLYRNGWYSSF